MTCLRSASGATSEVTEPAELQPPCECAAKGQPMTEFGVMHLADCAWLAWLGSTGGCQGDV